MARPGGNPEFGKIRNTNTTAANEAREKLANDFAWSMLPLLNECHHELETSSSRERAEWLNEKGYPTRRGNPWTTREVERLRKRIVKLIRASHKQKGSPM